MVNAIEEYRKKFGIQTKTTSPIQQYRERFKQTTTITPSPIETYRQEQGITPRIRQKNLDTSEGLYNIASQSGLKNQADRILASQKGEETKKIFSGGFISDIFDVLNSAQYGVTGMLKGKSFAEGVKTRQSFSDKDALGNKGIPGVIAGILLDIAVDPFTYIAPWTIIKKISPLMKLGKAIKGAVFGKKVIKSIQEGIKTPVISPKVPQPLAQEARSLESSISKAKASGQSFDEWVKGQGDWITEEARAYNTFDDFKNDWGFLFGEANKNSAPFSFRVSDNIGLRTRESVAKEYKINPNQIYQVDVPTTHLDPKYKGTINPDQMSSMQNAPAIAVVLKDGKLTVADGNHRTAQAIEFGYDAVPAWVIDKDGVMSKLQGEYIADFFDASKSLKTRSQLKAEWDRVGVTKEARIEPLVKVERPFQEVGKIGERTFETLESGTKLGRYLADKFVWMFGADSVFKETYERGLKNLGVSSQIVGEMGRAVAKIKPETAAKILSRDKAGRFFRTSLDTIKGQVTPDEFETISQFYNKIDSLGKEAVDLGLLGKGKYEENIGQYLKNTYTEYELAKGKGLFGAGKVGIKGIKKRVEGLTAEQMKELGQIENPAYLLFKSAFDLTRDVENAKLFKLVGEKFGTDIAQEGFVKIPSGIKYGRLADKYLPQNMADYISEIIPPTGKGALERFGQGLIGNFKFFKVVMNPATHARNIISNKLLNWWKLGMNPLDPRVIKNDLETMAEISKGGKWIDEAKTVGYGIDTFASQEMKNILDTPEATLLNKANKLWPTFKKKLGDIYQGEENFAKLSAFIWNRKKGVGIEEAWKAAESATFNYAQVTPFVRKLRTAVWGMPFITFTVKSTPVAIKTALKAPQRISSIGKIKQAIESQSDIKETDKERASEPPWVRNGFYIKLPMKDKQGRSAYFDLTYILPFGDLVSGQFLERGIERKTGLPTGIPQQILGKAPALNLIKELSRNSDFYGNQIWKESDSTEKQLKDIMRHLTKTYIPPLVGNQLPGGYDKKGNRIQKGILGALKPLEKENQQRTLQQEILREVGIKIQPINADIQETYQEWNKKRAFQTLLLENGILNEYTRTYVPKE